MPRYLFLSFLKLFLLRETSVKVCLDSFLLLSPWQISSTTAVLSKHKKTHPAYSPKHLHKCGTSRDGTFGCRKQQQNTETNLFFYYSFRVESFFSSNSDFWNLNTAEFQFLPNSVIEMFDPKRNCLRYLSRHRNVKSKQANVSLNWNYVFSLLCLGLQNQMGKNSEAA